MAGESGGIGRCGIIGDRRGEAVEVVCENEDGDRVPVAAACCCARRAPKWMLFLRARLRPLRLPGSSESARWAGFGEGKPQSPPLLLCPSDDSGVCDVGIICDRLGSELPSFLMASKGAEYAPPPGLIEDSSAESLEEAARPQLGDTHPFESPACEALRP